MQIDLTDKQMSLIYYALERYAEYCMIKRDDEDLDLYERDSWGESVLEASKLQKLVCEKRSEIE